MSNAPSRPRHCLLVPEYLESARRKVRDGVITAANHPAYARLLSEAEEVLSAIPLSVLQKKHTPPSGDMRDYFSLSIYFWPDENSPDGLPYVASDGKVNPEIADYDRPNFEITIHRVDTLALAYAFTGEERFAAKAAELLRVWFINRDTRMNPNMLFAQYIPGDNVVMPWKNYPARFVPGKDGLKGIFVSFGGVIEDLELVPLTDALRLLQPSKSWTSADQAAMVAWYAAYTEWLLTHQHGLDEASCKNNHGSWYWADIVCFLDFIGVPADAAKYAADMLPKRLQLQVEPDGSQPEELVRAISQNYTAFTICSFTNLAVAADRCGFNAWRCTTPDGRSIPKALDWFLPYLGGKTEWTWKQIKPFDEGYLIGLLAAAAEGTSEPRYRDALSLVRADASDRDRLLFDI